MGSGKSKKTGTNRKGGSVHKRAIRKKFRERHIDQVWEDVRRPVEMVHDAGTYGPMGTMGRYAAEWTVLMQKMVYVGYCDSIQTVDSLTQLHTALRRVALDEDVPAGGKYYCVPCSRYFISEKAQQDHEKTKLHKKRVKVLEGPKPHGQKDAEWAAGMGADDTGIERMG